MGTSLNIRFSLVLGFLLSFCFCQLSLAAPRSPLGKIYLPVMICDGDSHAHALSLYEGKTLRGLQYLPDPAPSAGFDLEERKLVFAEAAKALRSFSPTRADFYLSKAPTIAAQVKGVAAGTLANGDFYNEILLPSQCHLKTLAVFELADSAYVISGYVDRSLWSQLPHLDQKAIALEMHLSNELMLSPGQGEVITPTNLNLGTRALAGYLFAQNTPLKSMPERFEILRRIGFQYAESDIGMCIHLDKKIAWKNSVPVAGYSFDWDVFQPRCFFQWQNQRLHLDGYFLTSDQATTPVISALSVHHISAGSGPGFFDSGWSELYGQNLFFQASDLPVRFYPNGSVEYGVLNGTTEPTLKWESAELQVGYPWNGPNAPWNSVEIALWPNGKPRRIEAAAGKVKIQGQWYAINSKNIFVYESGQIECAQFAIGAKFKRKTGGIFTLTGSNYFACFDEQGYPTEAQYSSAEGYQGDKKSYYPFEEDPGVDDPRP